MSELTVYDAALPFVMYPTGTCFHDAVKFFDNLALATGPLGRSLRTLPSRAWKVVHATSVDGCAHAWVDVHTDLEHLCIQAVVLRGGTGLHKMYVAHQCLEFYAACGEISARVYYSLSQLIEQVTMTSSVGPWDRTLTDACNGQGLVSNVIPPPHIVLFEDVLIDAESRAARHQAFQRLG